MDSELAQKLGSRLQWELGDANMDTLNSLLMTAALRSIAQSSPSLPVHLLPQDPHSPHAWQSAEHERGAGHNP